MTIITPAFFIRGEIASDDALVIHGQVKGSVIVRGGSVTIAEQGRVEAAVRGVRVVVSGTVQGAVSATEHIELRASARVTGSLSADRVVIADGAWFSGQVDMGRRTIAAAVAQFRDRGATP